MTRLSIAFASLLLTGALMAQENKGVLVTYTLQPLESFKAQFQSTLPGVASYSAMICNLESVPRTVSGGEIYQGAFSRGLLGLSQQFNRPTIAATQRRSKLYIFSRILTWFSFGGTTYTVVKGDRIKPEWRVVAPTFTAALTMINDAFTSRLATTADLDLLDPEEVIQLGQRGTSSCKERIFLGSYRKESVPPVIINDQAP